MDALIPQFLGLIFFMFVVAIGAILFLAVVRPELVKPLLKALEGLTLALIDKIGDERQKRKNDEDEPS